MSQQVPPPFESRNEAESFFNELVGDKTAKEPARFSLSGFSSDSVLDLFRDETNAMLKGEISKIKELTSSERLNLELRLSGWKDRLDVAIDRLDERIQVLANVQAPQKKESLRRDAEDRRPIAFALLKAIKAGLVQQTHELAKVQNELVVAQLASTHGELASQLVDFFSAPKAPQEAEKKLDQFSSQLLQSFSKSFGVKGLAGLALFIKSIQDKLPKEMQPLFIKEFLAEFQERENVQVVLGEKGTLNDLLQLHEKMAPSFSPDAPGVTVTMMDESGMRIQYSRGLFDLKTNAPMTQNVPIPQGSLSSDVITLLAAELLESGALHPEDDIRTFFPEFKTKITVEDLITMKSGLADVEMLAKFSGKDPQTLTVEEKLELVQKFPTLSFEPGSDTKVQTSTNYLLLAKIIEKTTGEEIADYAKKTLMLPDTHFGGELRAVGYVYNDEKGMWVEKPIVANRYEVVSTPKDLAGVHQTLLDMPIVAEGVAHTEFSAYSAFTLLFFGIKALDSDQRFSLYFATNREEQELGAVAREVEETFNPIPSYGLAFVPFPIRQDDKEAFEALQESDELQKLLKRFEGSYRSEVLLATWQLSCKKKRVASLDKEYWGLEVIGISDLFFIPTTIQEDKAILILAERPTCKLHFSKNEFTLQDPIASISTLLFKKMSA